ncbi:MAG: MotA/TolQ/ExbB proton channel family protein [Hyphomicrobiales bacterium]|nr:MotA/TolQ/ExbB proton channel family protein [Hyphomicrobiales bacterium]
MANDRDLHRLSRPGIYLVRMAIFLLLAGFVALILYKQIAIAFMANPGLNALIIFVLLIGILLAIRQVWRLIPEVRWVNALRAGDAANVRQPVLLAPMARLIGDNDSTSAISTLTLRAILDSVGSRLDESREIARYLTGLLVFLGLLGTFWGLLETVGAIGGVIKSLKAGNDATVMFDDLKNGLAAPIAGMSIAFTSSLFGLAGSLILGFLDLQAGQAQNRFYNELEDNLSASATDPLALQSAGLPAGLAEALAKISAGGGEARSGTAAMANLAEGVQGLVKHMRNEQQMIRDWVEAQSANQRELKDVLERLTANRERL